MHTFAERRYIQRLLIEQKENVEEAIQMVSYGLQTYTTDNAIAGTDATVTRYSEHPALSPPQYAETLVTKPLMC